MVPQVFYFFFSFPLSDLHIKFPSFMKKKKEMEERACLTFPPPPPTLTQQAPAGQRGRSSAGAMLPAPGHGSSRRGLPGNGGIAAAPAEEPGSPSPRQTNPGISLTWQAEVPLDARGKRAARKGASRHAKRRHPAPARLKSVLWGLFFFFGRCFT